MKKFIQGFMLIIIFTAFISVMTEDMESDDRKKQIGQCMTVPDNLIGSISSGFTDGVTSGKAMAIKVDNLYFIVIEMKNIIIGSDLIEYGIFVVNNLESGQSMIFNANATAGAFTVWPGRHFNGAHKSIECLKN